MDTRGRYAMMISPEDAAFLLMKRTRADLPGNLDAMKSRKSGTVCVVEGLSPYDVPMSALVVILNAGHGSKRDVQQAIMDAASRKVPAVDVEYRLTLIAIDKVLQSGGYSQQMLAALDVLRGAISVNLTIPQFSEAA